MKLIIGLGNAGDKYKDTRHNLGFLVIDEIAKNLELTFKETPSSSYSTTFINGEKIIFGKPKLYMNNSGKVIKGMLNYFKIDNKNLFIIQDDKDQEIGKYKIVSKSGHGGQNGIRDIIDNIGTNEFTRLKVGIGSDKNIDTANYVLGKWTKEQKKIVNENMETYVNITKDFIELDFTKLANKYNGK